jgi:hypothetical protein
MEGVTVIMNVEEEGMLTDNSIVCVQNMENKNESSVKNISDKDLYGMVVDYNPISVGACMNNVNTDEDMNINLQNTFIVQDSVVRNNRNITPISGRGLENIQRSVDQEECTGMNMNMNIISMRQLTIFDTWGVSTSARLGNYNLGLGLPTPKKPVIRSKNAKISAKTSTLRKNRINTISKNAKSKSNYLQYFGKRLDKQGAIKSESTRSEDSMAKPNTNGGGVGGVRLHGL